ncbi:meiosis 1 arrest protein [Alosa pseudoharengus]|uniref:meiosis 1 arrest protein n=1 Tax=Alosa pseudoharengus TaxID=34774 RepID=UPI003F8B959E
MSVRNRPGSSPMPACQPSAFSRQPPRVLIVDTSPPWWSETGAILCEALDNFLTLASSLEGPSRLPLLSVYAVNLQQECLLPFVQVKGNLVRLRLCVDELRSLPGEGCVRPRGFLLRRAVLDSLQQYRQYSSHHAAHYFHTGIPQVTVMTSQPGRALMRELEAGLKDSELGSLRRLLVVQISPQQQPMAGEQGWTPDGPSPEDSEEGLMLGTEMDLQVVESSVVAVESVLKAWLHEQAGEREHLHLLLPRVLQHASGPAHAHADGPRKPSPICLKCDMQERLLSPSLLPSASAPHLATKTESVRDFQPHGKGPANHSPPPQRLRVVKTLHADGVCESVLYGLPLIIRPTICWQLDWDEIETNQQLFHALCHTLREREWFLLVRTEPAVGSALASSASVSTYYVLQPSPSLSLLLLKPVVTQELMLPCSMPYSNQDPPLSALITVENSLQSLEEDPVFNPLCLGTNLYPHLRMRSLASRPAHPYRRQDQTPTPTPTHSQGHGAGVSPGGQSQRREPPVRPPEGSMARQSHGRQSQQARARATVAPLPPPSGPPAKSSRPPLTFSKPSSSSCLGESDDDDDLIMML